MPHDRSQGYICDTQKHATRHIRGETATAPHHAPPPALGTTVAAVHASAGASRVGVDEDEDEDEDVGDDGVSVPPSPVAVAVPPPPPRLLPSADH